MTCEQIQDLLLTDYADKEMPESRRKAVDSHLAACAPCREFAAAVQAVGLDPFCRAESLQPAEKVWEAVQAEVFPGEGAEVGGSWLDRLRERVTLRPVLLWGASCAVMLLTAAVVLRLTGLAGTMSSTPMRDEEAYLTYLASPLTGAAEQEGFGTAIEQYFL